MKTTAVKFSITRSHVTSRGT